MIEDYASVLYESLSLRLKSENSVWRLDEDAFYLWAMSVEFKENKNSHHMIQRPLVLNSSVNTLVDTNELVKTNVEFALGHIIYHRNLKPKSNSGFSSAMYFKSGKFDYLTLCFTSMYFKRIMNDCDFLNYLKKSAKDFSILGYYQEKILDGNWQDRLLKPLIIAPVCGNGVNAEIMVWEKQNTVYRREFFGVPFFGADISNEKKRF